MKPIPIPIRTRRGTDKFLVKILLQTGSYYQSADLFYQRHWRLRLRHIGFRVIAVERTPLPQGLWEIKLCGNLTAQSYLLISKPVPKKHLLAKDLLERQLIAEVRQIALDLGATIRRDWISVAKNGAYLLLSFIWQKGRPGILLNNQPKAHALPFLIRPWLRRNRN